MNFRVTTGAGSARSLSTCCANPCWCSWLPSREEITDLMAGGETMVDLKAKIVSCFGCSDAVRPLATARDIFQFGSLHPSTSG